MQLSGQHQEVLERTLSLQMYGLQPGEMVRLLSNFVEDPRSIPRT